MASECSGATPSTAARPASVRRTIEPRASSAHSSRATKPRFSILLTRCDTRLASQPSSPATSRRRPVAEIVTAHRQLEGAGFSVRRPFPGELSMTEADPFLLLDHLGPQVNGPGEASGAPWHPHRGFETVSYILDGEIAHHDTNGGGGVIGEGDTQWMTAGGGILHAQPPTH